MKILSASKRLLKFLFLALIAVPVTFAQDKLVLSQVYGGGGSASASATYQTDFIEIFNAGATSVDLTQYSVQYGPSGSSATPSTVFSGITVLAPTALPGNLLAPGQYYFINEGNAASPTPGGAVLTGADQTGTINLSGSSGKVALVKGTTLLNTAGSCASTSIVSLVGYGTIFPTSCAAGSAPVSGMSISASVKRNSSCSDTGNNAADFTAGTPAPRNTSTTLAPCPVVTTLAVTGASANPASVTAGNVTTLTATVTPTTGVAISSVTVDLSSIGGSTTTAMVQSGTTNTYTYSETVPGGTAANSYTLPVKVTDASTATASGSIALTVQSPISLTPIATLQANRSTYLGTTVETTGVVVAVIRNAFFIQMPSTTPGSTGFAEGLDVFTSTVPTVALGDNVTVTGKLVQFVPDPTSSGLDPSLLSHMPGLEISGPAITINSHSNPLPAAIVLPTGFPTANGGIYQLTQYEGMRVTFPSVTTVGPTDASLVEATETVTSTGEFYGTATGIARPYREPGMDFRDFPKSTCPTITNCTSTTTTLGAPRPANVVLYDDNPERVLFESASAGGTAVDLSPGAVLTSITGVVDFTYATDTPYGDPARIFLDPGTITVANYLPSTLTITPLPLPSASQFTVAAFNVERFFDPDSTNNKYFNAGTGNVSSTTAVNVTADAYARRLKKFSLAIRTVLNSPDIISVEEVENIQVLKDMAKQIDDDTTTGAKPGYVAYGTDSTTTFTSDSGGISIGFLVKPATTNVTSWEQKGTTDKVPTGTTLNDRPSQVLHATINRGTGNVPYPITVISNHLRSLNNIADTPNVRVKKELQAEMLATLIQGYQTAGEHVIAVGDMNAFQFSDGYTDTIGTITGNLSPAGTAVQPGKAIVSPAAVDLINTLSATAQQSYTEWGSAQVLDHAIVTADIASTTTLAVGHIDADFPVILYNDATTPAAMSDHDPLLAYLALPAPVVKGTLTGTATFPDTSYFNSSAGQQFTLTNNGEAPITITGVAATGDFAQNNNCGASLAVSSTCLINVVFSPTARGTRTGALTVTSSGTIAPVALSGTGLGPASALSLTGTTTFPTTLVGVASAAQAFTLTNGSASTINLTAIAATGDFTQTNTCGTSLAAGASCAVNIIFKPTASGARTGNLAVTFSAGSFTGGAVSFALTGAGAVPTFSLDNGSGVTTTTIAVIPGGTATGSVKFTSVNGFAGSIALTCAPVGTAPQGLTCAVTSPVTLAAGGTATATITITATARAITGGFAMPRNGRAYFALLLMMMAAAVLMMRRAGRNVRMVGLLTLLFAISIGISGCGGSSSTTSTTDTGTPNGTYAYRITASSGGVTGTQAVSVTVQ